jgi:hypothetical protein
MHWLPLAHRLPALQESDPTRHVPLQVGGVGVLPLGVVSSQVHPFGAARSASGVVGLSSASFVWAAIMFR